MPRHEQKKWLHPIKHVDNFIHNLTETKMFIGPIRTKINPQIENALI